MCVGIHNRVLSIIYGVGMYHNVDSNQVLSIEKATINMYVTNINFIKLCYVDNMHVYMIRIIILLCTNTDSYSPNNL